jgi:hypothetical protein
MIRVSGRFPSLNRKKIQDDLYNNIFKIACNAVDDGLNTVNDEINIWTGFSLGTLTNLAKLFRSVNLATGPPNSRAEPVPNPHYTYPRNTDGPARSPELGKNLGSAYFFFAKRNQQLKGSFDTTEPDLKLLNAPASQAGLSLTSARTGNYVAIFFTVDLESGFGFPTDPDYIRFMEEIYARLEDRIRQSFDTQVDQLITNIYTNIGKYFDDNTTPF